MSSRTAELPIRTAGSRILGLVGAGDHGVNHASLKWFRIFMLLLVGVRAMCMYVAELGAGGSGLPLLVLQVIPLCCLGGLIFPYLRSLATRVVAGLVLVHVIVGMPLTANHAFLELIVLGLLAGLDETRDDEAELLGQGLRWMTVIFFFYTGFQKLLYGYYFDGQYLGYSTATGAEFADMFRYILPEAELTRLQAENAVRDGAGPYSVDSVPFLVLSNGVYMFEMIAAVLLLFARTRTAAAIASIAFVIGVELGAREIFFGIFTINLLMLFLPGPWTRRMFPLFALMLGWLAGVAFGILPIFTFKV